MALIIIAFGNINTSNAQYFSIGDEWTFTKSLFQPLGDIFTYKVVSDTVIHGKTTSEIVKFSSDNTPEDVEYLYAQNDSVFFWYNNSFNLMYDFATNVGDTTLLNFKARSLQNINLDSILEVSVLIERKIDTTIGNTILKLVTAQIIPIPSLSMAYVWPYRITYIENIGNIEASSFLNTLPLSTKGDDSYLRCFQNQTVSYTSEFWENVGNSRACDFILTSINEVLVSNSVKLFPNPAISTLQIEISDNMEIESIELFNIEGKKVKTFNATDRNLNVSFLNSGTYFLKLSTEKETLTKKVMIE